jgi:hypothetical protein
MKLNPNNGEVTDWRRMDVETKQNEKNWMPILSCHQNFMYRPGWVIDNYGQFVSKHEPTLAVDQLSGGGQCVPFDGGYIAIVHEARPDPTNGKRYYQHRFVWFDKEYVLRKVSKPFVFFDKQIEFAAGLAHDEHLDRFIVSFGVLDREAWLAAIYAHEVRDLLWAP